MNTIVRERDTRRASSKRKGRKRKGLPTLASLRRKLDQVFSKFIRKRDANTSGLGQCYTCNRWAVLEASHFIPRQHAATRWDERNVHGACFYCNRWQHGDLYAYGLALQKQYGQATVDELWRSRRQAVKFHRSDLEALIVKYSA